MEAVTQALNHFHHHGHGQSSNPGPVVSQTTPGTEFSRDVISVQEYGYCEDANPDGRPYMEDMRFACDNILGDGQSGLFGILDGHGGKAAATYCQKNLPAFFQEIYRSEAKTSLPDVKHVFTRVFKALDAKLAEHKVGDGATVGVIFIRNEGSSRVLYAINLGDTRAVLVRGLTVGRLTVDHTASNPSEQKRIESEGGHLMTLPGEGVPRVGGNLIPSRTLGDLALKGQGVSNVPHVSTVKITPGECVVLASDGLWDVVKDKMAAEIIQGGANAKEMATSLVRYALKHGSQDNISVIVLKL